MTGRTLRRSRTPAVSAAAQLDIDREAVASRLSQASSLPASQTTPYPGVSLADAIAAANPRKRLRKRAKPRSGAA